VGGAPEKPVVDDEELGSSVCGKANRGHSGIDRGSNARNAACILDLETIDRTLPVTEFVDAKGAVATLDYTVKRDMTHDIGSEADFGML